MKSFGQFIDLIDFGHPPLIPKISKYLFLCRSQWAVMRLYSAEALDDLGNKLFIVTCLDSHLFLLCPTGIVVDSCPKTA